jgi:hypothetical protein
MLQWIAAFLKDETQLSQRTDPVKVTPTTACVPQDADRTFPRVPPATETRKSGPSSRRRRVVIAVASAVVLLCLFRVLSPSAPTVRFVRFDTDADGKPVAICRVTNPGIASIGILGFSPRLAQWCVQDTATGALLDSQYVCGTGMSFHAIGPLQSREIEIHPPRGVRGVRYGIYYDVPSDFYRAWRERFRAMGGRYGTSQIAWTDEIPR